MRGLAWCSMANGGVAHQNIHLHISPNKLAFTILVRLAIHLFISILSNLFLNWKGNTRKTHYFIWHKTPVIKQIIPCIGLYFYLLVYFLNANTFIFLLVWFITICLKMERVHWSLLLSSSLLFKCYYFYLPFLFFDWFITNLSEILNCTVAVWRWNVTTILL